MARLCVFRPTVSLSLRRPGLGLSETRSRLGEVTRSSGWFERDFSPRRQVVGVLSDVIARPGEGILPKRDDMMLLLF